MISEAIGDVLIGGVLLQLGLVCVESVRRGVGQRRQSDLALETLKTELEIIRDLRRKPPMPPCRGMVTASFL